MQKQFFCRAKNYYNYANPRLYHSGWVLLDDPVRSLAHFLPSAIGFTRFFQNDGAAPEGRVESPAAASKTFTGENASTVSPATQPARVPASPNNATAPREARFEDVSSESISWRVNSPLVGVPFNTATKSLKVQRSGTENVALKQAGSGPSSLASPPLHPLVLAKSSAGVSVLNAHDGSNASRSDVATGGTGRGLLSGPRKVVVKPITARQKTVTLKQPSRVLQAGKGPNAKSIRRTVAPPSSVPAVKTTVKQPVIARPANAAKTFQKTTKSPNDAAVIT